MKVVVISGYFNPLHVGHLDYIENAKKLGDYLIVIINSDNQVKIKGSRPFMKEQDRKRIVSAIKPVDETIISIDKDASVVQTLKSLWDRYSTDPFFDSMIFANGGDRKKGFVPEVELCENLGIIPKYGIGGEKVESSSNLINIHVSKIRGV
jgi:cytidyltransferase-like protein